MAKSRPTPNPADTPHSKGTVAVLADDLIWASRLVAAVEKGGATPVRLSTLHELKVVLEADLEGLLGVIVDLNGRRYDGVAAVALAVKAGKSVIAAAEHDDMPTRKAALDAGAQRVFAYAKLFSDGPAVVARWLAANATGATA